MDSTAEGEVRSLVTPDIEPVRILEHLWIPVGCAQKKHDVVAFPQRMPVHLTVGEHTPKIRLCRGVKAE